MLGSILLYVVVGELTGPAPRPVNATFSYIFSTLSVAVVGMIFVVRRTLVFHSAESLASDPENVLTLSHWKTGYVATYALCETLALFGVVLRFLGYNLQQSLPFYVGGFVLIAFFRPRLPVKPSAS
jgi:F0F1-type ATP synthase membrane subunit c/vacuolar-type H+-ATPase subunit K